MRGPRLNKKIPLRPVIVSLILLVLAGGFYNIWSSLLPDRTPRYWRYQTLTTDICDNSLSRVKADLDGGTDPNDFPPSGIDEGDIAPLNLAVLNEKIPMVQLLLDHHADINIGDGWDEAPLNEAAHDENIPMMKFLIAHGAIVNDDGIGGSDVLCRAALDNNINSVKCLLANKANPNTLEDTTPQKSLLSAVKSCGYTSIAKLLKKAGAKG